MVALGLIAALVGAQAPPPPVVTNTLPPTFDTNAQVREVRPAQIDLAPALAEIVRLAQSGADDSVVIAYIQKAPAYRLNADEIIYLQDLGISDPVLKALTVHSQTAPATSPAPSPPTNAIAPTNPAVAPVPDPQPVTNTAAPPATVVEFYEPLAPYGTWVEVAPYGWCWQPSVVVINSGWRPYCDNGYWLWSDSGWYWHSYYSWGWAPFHYGRWFYHPHRRWVWAPDRVWGPSWVSWRYGGDYCGWAPLPPGAHFSVGVGWTFGGRHVGPDFAFGLAPGHFTFVAAAHFADRRVAARSVPRTQINAVFHKTTVINNYVVEGNQRIVNRGVDRGRIEAATRTKIPEVAVRELPRERQRVTMPDRMTKVGKSDVVYRPGPNIEVPRKAIPTGPVRPAAVPDRGKGIVPLQPAAPTAPASPTSREAVPRTTPAVPTRPPVGNPSSPQVTPPAPVRPRIATPNAPPPGRIAPPPKVAPRQGQGREEQGGRR